MVPILIQQSCQTLRDDNLRIIDCYDHRYLRRHFLFDPAQCIGWPEQVPNRFTGGPDKIEDKQIGRDSEKRLAHMIWPSETAQETE